MVALLYVILIVLILKILNKVLGFWCRSKVCLVGKTAVVTGGASGIGFEVALGLASKGCRVIIADIANLTEAVEQLKEMTDNPLIIGLKVDLESFKSVRKLAAQIIETEPQLDILVCNAGISEHLKRNITSDGLEKVMQINYFSHFLLTHLLLDLLKKSGPSRITFTSSILAYYAHINVDQLTPDQKYYDSFLIKLKSGTYGGSKVCMAAAAKLFGEKLKDTGVIANADLPMFVKTPIFWKAIKTDKNYLAAICMLVTQIVGMSAEQGAQTLLQLAHSKEVEGVTGKTFVGGMVSPKPPLLTEEFCQKLWMYSIEYTKLQPHEIKC